MVPCGWFPATAAYCRANADNPRLDMGVHLTVTCEWDTPRWGPVSGRDPATGLMDDEGYFFRSAAPVQAGADGAAVVAELRAQVQQAQAAGIDITHVDTHMFALAHPHLLARLSASGPGVWRARLLAQSGRGPTTAHGL